MTESHYQDGIRLPMKDDVSPLGQWIKCKERMPELKQTVLVYGNGHYCVCTFDGGNARTNQYLFYPYDMNKNITGITHWMPLPEKPNE